VEHSEECGREQRVLKSGYDSLRARINRLIDFTAEGARASCAKKRERASEKAVLDPASQDYSISCKALKVDIVFAREIKGVPHFFAALGLSKTFLNIITIITCPARAERSKPCAVRS